MTENLKQFLDEMSSYSDEDGAAVSGSTVAPRVATDVPVIGKVVEIAGSGSRVVMDSARLHELMSHPD